ncbi:MAG: hypothetical protein AAF402_10415 [Pseudomonadota bacterium]
MVVRFLNSLLISAALISVPSLGADISTLMQSNYREYVAKRQADPDVLPFDLSSEEKRIGGESVARVRYLLKGIPFEVFALQLSTISEWCEFIPLHLNIKACAAITRGDQQYLQFYAGVKGYLTPKEASLLELEYSTKWESELFLVDMYAPTGPYRTTDVNFDIRAIPVEEGIYFEFDLSSVPGVAAQLAKVYLATVGRNKIGFSSDGTNWRGKPKYVGGQRGAAERNIVRYLLAIETYFDTLELPAENQFEARIMNWFDSTERYRKQLFELEREDYLSIKRRERRNQEILKAAIANNTTPVYKVPVEKRQ